MYGREQVQLGGFFDTLYNIGKKVVSTAGDVIGYADPVLDAVHTVSSGQGSIAVVPNTGPSVVYPVPGSPLALGAATPMPSWVLPVGLGLVAALLISRRR